LPSDFFMVIQGCSMPRMMVFWHSFHGILEHGNFAKGASFLIRKAGHPDTS
jgi:hypothetical protein